MTIIQENNLLSFQEFLFSESFASQARAGEKAWQDDQKATGKGSVGTSDSLFLELPKVDKEGKVRKFNISMDDKNLQKIISTLATKYTFSFADDSDLSKDTKIGFPSPNTIKPKIKEGKIILVKHNK
jgi:hypothetical protein